VTERRIARYRLLRRIGAGGMAEVFRAELEGAEGVTRALVVKRIHGALAQDPDAVAMFVAEARIAAKLTHPNVVQVYEFGRDADDYFLAMELVDGCDLATLMQAWRTSPAPMGLTAWVMGELLEALAYVHGLKDERGEPLGLVHRDVSPHNVLVGAAGEVKLADFGIATAARRVVDAGEKVKGKLAFMAPEQCRGEAVDARADLFGAGAILYELLSGARPYREREGATLVESVRAGDIVPLRERAPWLSDELCDVVSRAIAADPSSRFADARAFHRAMDDAFAEDAVRPDRAMLASAVRARVESDPPEPAARTERTVTANEVAAAPDPVAPAAPPARPSRVRRILERAAIAVAVFVVAILAERRTRPAAPVSAPAPDVAVVLRAPESFARSLRAMRRGLESSCGVSLALPVGDDGDADIALRRWRDFARAPGDAGDLREQLDAAALREALRVSSSLGASLRTPVDVPAAVRFAPLGLDPVVLFARRSALAALAEGRDDDAALRDAAREVFGVAPRGARTPTAELDGWGAWELAMASISLRHRGFASYRVWVAAGPGALPEKIWSARAATYDPEAATDLRASQGLALTLGWDRATQALEVLAVGADITDDESLPPSRPEVAFGWAPLSHLRGVDPQVWRLSRPPRGDDWRLDPRGEPLRLGGHLVPTELYGWTASARALTRPAVRCALTRLTSALQPAMQRATGLAGLGELPEGLREASDAALRESLEGGRLTLLRDAAGGSARRRDGWWNLWRDAVLGSARGDASAERAMHEAWRARAASTLGSAR
jgi:hypothetical protein